MTIRSYITQNSTFTVDHEKNTVRREHDGENPRWHDGQDIPFTSMEHREDGGLLFEVIDPYTGKPRPFITSRLREVRETL